MIYAYIRVSTDKQDTENQRFEIFKFTDVKKITIDKWIEETVSGTKKAEERKLGSLILEMKKKDILIMTEISRLGRSLMEIMSVLHNLMEKDITVFTTRENYELGKNISSQVLAFAFGLSAQIERDLISQRTKEALARKKSEGIRLGRPKGKLSKVTKLTGKEEDIKELLRKKIPVASIARIFTVHRVTMSRFIESRELKKNLFEGMKKQ